jgi:hypothetical protein
MNTRFPRSVAGIAKIGCDVFDRKPPTGLNQDAPHSSGGKSFMKARANQCHTTPHDCYGRMENCNGEKRI